MNEYIEGPPHSKDAQFTFGWRGHKEAFIGPQMKERDLIVCESMRLQNIPVVESTLSEDEIREAYLKIIETVRPDESIGLKLPSDQLG